VYPRIVAGERVGKNVTVTTNKQEKNLGRVVSSAIRVLLKESRTFFPEIFVIILFLFI
jgi:hypothetical protein